MNNDPENTQPPMTTDDFKTTIAKSMAGLNMTGEKLVIESGTATLRSKAELERFFNALHKETVPHVPSDQALRPPTKDYGQS